jgi:hypothetical protein
MTVMFQVEVFGVVAPCSVVVEYQRFRGPCYLYLQSEDGGSIVLRNVGILPTTTIRCVTTQKTSTWICWIYSAASLHITLISILLLSSNLHLGLPPFSSIIRFTNQSFIRMSHLPLVCVMPHKSSTNCEAFPYVILPLSRCQRCWWNECVNSQSGLPRLYAPAELHW